MRSRLVRLLVSICFVGFGCNSPESQNTVEPYVVEGMTVDSSNSTMTMMIRINGPATQSNVKSAAEAAIGKYRDQYSVITVKSYIGSSSLSGLPYATSMLENNKIAHQFNPQAATQKIPTH